MFKRSSISFKLISFFAVVIFVSISIALLTSVKIVNSLDKKIVDIREQQRPADINITIIKDSSCQECFDVSGVVAGIKKFNVNILSEESVEYNSESAQVLINKYSISKMPALVIEGELDKEGDFNNILKQIGIINDGVFVSSKLSPPYLSLNSGEIIGKVQLMMLIDSSCEDCYDVDNHKRILTGFGVYVDSEKILDVQTSEGKNLLNKYNIELLPTIILSEDADVYGSLKSVWRNIGTVEEDGSYIFRQGVKNMGVYKDMVNNKVIDPKAQTDDR